MHNHDLPIMYKKQSNLTDGKSIMSRDYVSKTPHSEALYARAKRVLPSGVSYAIRYFEPYPFYTTRAKGSKLYDVDGNEYVDFWLGHTALILGHCPPSVQNAIKEQLEVGSHYGTSHELEVKLAEQVVEIVPNVEMIRFTNSGTEANMYATRLARAYNQRSKIAKFEGGWHGGYDPLHVGVEYPFNSPEFAGLTSGATKDTITLPFNNLQSVAERLRNEQVAAIIIEPVLGAGGCIPAEKDFLKGLREYCDEKGILLIFDEVITGFRLAPGGGQQYYGVRSDLTVFGKILGGGLPIGAFCGRKDIMERLDSITHGKAHSSFHGGTFAANPMTMAAGLETLRLLKDGRKLHDLNKAGGKIRRELGRIFETHDISVHITGIGSLFSTHFTDETVADAHTAYRADRKMLVEYNLALIAGGVFFLPAHSGALSTAHSEADVENLFKETETYARNS